MKLRLIAALAAVFLLAACTQAADTTTTVGGTPTTADGGVTTTADTGGTTAPAGETTTTGATEPGDGLLAEVQARGSVRCGINEAVPGFGFLEADGTRSGFDIDFCRAVAAAIFGDPEAVEFVPLTAQQRFTALQAGEIDVLSRNTTWTASRDGTEGATFLHPLFYDGQQMMVGADSGFDSIDAMDGAVICVAAGTTTEGNVATEFAARGITADVQSFESVDLIQEAFLADRCDGWSSDGSQLAGIRSNWPDGPEALTIFEDVFSKEPLTPAVSDGDAQWAQAVNWVLLATVQAEEYGITSENVDDMLAGEDAAIAQFLGGETEDGTTLDTGLGLSPDFAYNIVSQVGNYGEIFENNLSQLELERGLNALWSDGGLQYAPPYR